MELFIMKTIKENKFDKFWKLYPRKVSKFSAKRTWNRLKNEEIEEIFKVMSGHIIRWREKEIKYVPHPSTWLNQKRWEDELEPIPKKETSADEIMERKAEEFRLKMIEAEKNMATSEEIKEALKIK